MGKGKAIVGNGGVLLRVIETGSMTRYFNIKESVFDFLYFSSESKTSPAEVQNHNQRLGKSEFSTGYR